MKENKKKEQPQEVKQSGNQKTAGNNQWANNNLKYYPDERERQDGPGGN